MEQEHEKFLKYLAAINKQFPTRYVSAIIHSSHAHKDP